MSKYQRLIQKIQNWPKDPNFTPPEIALMVEALETIQFLEIVLKSRPEI